MEEHVAWPWSDAWLVVLSTLAFEFLAAGTNWPRSMTAGELRDLLSAERARRVEALLQRPCVARPDGRE
jgi:hypothetical protein